jgi:pimeloyl-ACP methyl ester carboxylesterase
MPYVESTGVPIYYEVVGEGFSVVLQTGGGGDGTMWEQGGYVAGLDGFQRILLDHRGHGRSGKPTDLDAHRIECYVEDVIAVLDALGIERAAFWGYSSGAEVGLALAAAHPERIAALVVQGGIGEGDEDTAENHAQAQETARIARERGVGGFVESAFAEGAIPGWFMEQMRSTDGEMFALEVLGASFWQGPWSILDRIRCPVLMLAGEREDPEGNNERAAARLGRARSVTFPGLGHLEAYVRSDLALAEAVPFLREVAQREAAR